MDYSIYVQALVKAVGSQDIAAEMVGVSQPTINRWMNGTPVRKNNVPRLLTALQAASVPYVEKSFPEKKIIRPDTFRPEIIPAAPLVGDKSLPVYAAAMGGEGHSIITFDAIDYVKRPSILENVKEAYGVYIVGESMVPAFRPGDLALVHPHLPPQRETDVVLFHVPPSDDAECIIKRLLSFNDRDWRLEQYNPADSFLEPRASWPICHRVVGKYSTR